MAVTNTIAIVNVMEDGHALQIELEIYVDLICRQDATAVLLMDKHLREIIYSHMKRNASGTNIVHATVTVHGNVQEKEQRIFVDEMKQQGVTAVTFTDNEFKETANSNFSKTVGASTVTVTAMETGDVMTPGRSIFVGASY